MPIITLTTDLAGGSFYLAALKGSLLSINPNIQLVDITHSINHFDMRQAAYTLQQAAKYFPKNTIHLLHINSGESDRRLLMTPFNDQHFLFFNNGSGPLVFGNEPVSYYETEKIEEPGAIYSQTISNAIRQISENRFELKPAEKVAILRRLQPILRQGFIRGNFSTIDQFGNAITNISREMFKQYIGDKFEIAFNSYKIDKLSLDYRGATNLKGDLVAFFNSENLLEIAMNQASAEKLLGVRVEGVITIEDL
jgi:S-adenosylmethionine hydrolase